MVTVEIVRQNDKAGPKPRTWQLTLGADQALPQIEDVIRTLKPGEEGDFAVDLPQQADQADGPVERHDLHIHMIEAKRPERPALDDEFAKSVGDFEDLAALRDRIRSDLEQEAGREADRSVRYQLIQNIVDANPFEVPTSMLDDYLRKLLPDRDDLDKEKLAEIRAHTRPAAADVIRRHLVIERVAEIESLKATPAELDERLERVAQAVGRSVEQVRAQFQKNGRLAELESEITEEKVFQYLFTLSTIE
jgi:trigger factor